MKPVIFYLHGFASSADSEKVNVLREHFKNRNIKFVAESYNTYSAKESIEFIHDLVLKNLNAGETPIFCGTSLGGFWSLAMAAFYRGHFVIANPSLFPDVSLMKYVTENGLAKDFKGAVHLFNEENVLDFKNFSPVESIEKISGGKVLLCTGDEILADTFPTVVELLEEVSNIEWIDGGNHRFENMEKLISSIEEVIHYNVEVGVENE